MSASVLRSTWPGSAAMASVVCAAAMVLGCGPYRPSTAPVSGVVLLDGQPLADAAVTFVPVEGGRLATATTDAQGRFRLTAFDDEDGALLGEHIVTVFKQQVTGVVVEDGLDGGTIPGQYQVKSLAPERYASRTTSDLRVTVKRGMPPVTLQLTSP